MSTLFCSLLMSLAVQADQADPKPIIAKAIQAYGGEQKLANVKAVREKIKGSVDIQGVPLEFTGSSLLQFPGQIRQEIGFGIMGQRLRTLHIYNNGKGWSKVINQIKELEGDELRDVKEQLHYARVSTLAPLLQDKEFKLAWIGEDKVDRVPVIGIKVSARGHRDIDLYVDKSTGLVIKSVRTGRDPMTKKETKLETYYSDFKEVGGIKYAAKVKVHQEGVKFMEAEITEVELLDKVDDKEFDKPGQDA